MKAQLNTSPQLVNRRLLTSCAVTALFATALSLSAAEPGYTAHEWGTFTSIQGSDGVLLDWNGIATSDLPNFVYNWSKPGLKRFDPSMLMKASLTSLQRMETPVVYFYPDQPMSVDVTVEFPKGKITEWFPQARHVGPSSSPPSPLLTVLDEAAHKIGARPNPSFAARFGESPITNSVIHWEDFQLTPAKQNSALAKRLPLSATRSHYFAARETDAAFVTVTPMEETVTAPEVEKFLFYRGVGNFPTPLKVTMNPQEKITVANTGAANMPLKHLFALKVQGQKASFLALGDLDGSKSMDTQVKLDQNAMPLTEAVVKLSRQMARALESEGLYRAEAEAMVNTWRDAWFEDQGLRILYVLPRDWTDKTLPMTLQPQPRKLVRVMVGRAELISPSVEAQVRDCITQYRRSDVKSSTQAVQQFQALKLGRFAPVAIRLTAGKDAGFLNDGMKFLQAVEAQNAVAKLSSL